MAGLVSAWVRLHGGEPSQRWTGLFDLDGEANAPAWFSSVLLLRCAMASSRRGLRALAGVFVLLSLDEVAMVHERAAAALLGARVPWPWPWVMGAVVVAALGAALVPSLRALGRGERARAIVAGVVYVGGALGVEAVAQRWAEGHGWANAGYVAMTAVEEGMEMMGAVLFVWGIAAR